jgi:hypothetical protein
MSRYDNETLAQKSLDWLYNGNEKEIEKAMTDIRDYQQKKSPKEGSDEHMSVLNEKTKLYRSEKSDQELQQTSTRYSSKNLKYYTF